MEPDRKIGRRDADVDIPEDVVFQKILPQLPCKVLSRLKAVSKAYQATISDSHFSALQARNPSPLSAGFVYMEDRSGLLFLSDQLGIIGVPDPSLNFMLKYPCDVRLLCSTNGLLLFGLFGDDEQSDICVCNPATMETEILPRGWKASRGIFTRFAFDQSDIVAGFAFDPRAAPERYAVVDALHERTLEGTRYTFNVFQSRTGEWKLSKEQVYLPGLVSYCPVNPVYSRGILYWDCMDHLIWFDPEKDRSGTILLPHQEDTDHIRKFVEVFEDAEICCMCVTSEGGIEVWILSTDSGRSVRWERKYALSLERLIHESPDNLYFGLPDAVMLTGYPVEAFVTPLAFDGRNVYVAACTKVWLRVRDFAMLENSWNAGALSPDTHRKESDYAENNREADVDIVEEDLFCCDVVTGKVTSMKRSVIRTERNYRILHYRSSMAALPPILKS